MSDSMKRRGRSYQYLTGLSVIEQASLKDVESVQVTMREQRLSRQKLNLLLLLIFILNAFSTACVSSVQSGKSEQRIAETSETPAQAATAPTASTELSPQPTPAESVKLPPPKPEEVREVTARVYKDAVAIDTSHQPVYVVGDFNGDGSEDIAVVVKPAKGKLEEINSEVANWILEDPRRVLLPDPNKTVQKLPQEPGPVKVQPDDLLLTIIHGYKDKGWRNTEARQAYLLANAVGTSMTAAPLKDLLSANGNKNGVMQSGDVIKVTLRGEPGFIYWTGAKYAWHKKQ
ncbi:MAG: hypothetical protein QOH63_3501 [Acidobacteriota bacterium]|jgi:hypothetical protein|nr:hypothetical protein [Acidobacteriota bacterium]